MKLYKAIITNRDDSVGVTVYVEAEDYKEAEAKLWSEENTYWRWPLRRRIAEIKEIKDPLII